MRGVRLGLHRRLAVQLGCAVAVLTALGFAGVGWFVANRERGTLTREFTLRLLLEARGLAVATAAPLLRLDPELELHPLLTRALAGTPDLVDLVVLDSRGRIRGHVDLHRVGEEYAAAPLPGAVALTGGADGEILRLAGDQFVFDIPIRHLGQPIGRLVVRASRAGVESAVHASERQLAILGGLATALAVLAVVGLVSWGLRPLGELRRGVQRLGSGDLTARVGVGSRNELGLFGDLVNRMAAGLQSAQAERIQKERLDREIEIALELQSMLLPRAAPHVAGYDVDARCIPALEASGDYYDLLPLGADRLLLVTADVSGKGVPGLVVMSMLRTALHAVAHREMEVAKTLVAANGMLRGAMRRSMFVTCHAGILDLGSGEYRYASAGHCPPVRFGSGTATVLPAGGKPLGIFPDPVVARSLVERRLALRPAEGLLLFTDGLVEGFDPAGRMLGLDPVIDRLRTAGGAPSARIVADLVADLQRHCADRGASDDLTLIVVRREPVAAPVPSGRRS